jgi:predicted DsbA family dithiol-disulfide isomerase
VDSLKEKYQITVEVIHFPLHPDTPAEGRALADLFAGRMDQHNAMKTNLTRLMAEEGLPYGDRTHTYNSRLAQELGKWAAGQGKGDQFDMAMFRTYFVETQNISDPDVLVEQAGKVGLDEAAAREVLNERSFSAAIDEDWKRSMAMGVTGVPTYVVGQHGVVGAQPLEVLDDLLQKGDATPRLVSP